MQRRKFSCDFKLEAVRLVEGRGVAVAQAACDLDLHKNVLRKWVRQFADDPQHTFPGHGQMKPEQLEIDRLRKEVAELKAKRDILKSRSLLREGSDMRFAFVTRHSGVWPVVWLCEAQDISRSGFHPWLNRSPSAHSRHDEVLVTAIDRSFKSSD